jgi:hypothetical protein
MSKLGSRGLSLGAAACVLAIVAAAAGTKTVENEGGKKAPEPPPRKILVVAIVRDPLTRAGFEEVLAGELSLRGARAVASHLLFPELPKERGPFEERLAAEGFDAVTVSRLVDRDVKAKYKEETVSFDPQYMGMDMWGGYWYTYQQVYLPGYLEKKTRVRVRTDLWRASGKDSRIAWSGTSETIDPVTFLEAGREVAASVANALAKAKLI